MLFFRIAETKFKEIDLGLKNIYFSIFGVPNFLFGRTSFSGMLKEVMGEPPFREQQYSIPRLGGSPKRRFALKGGSVPKWKNRKVRKVFANKYN